MFRSSRLTVASNAPRIAITNRLADHYYSREIVGAELTAQAKSMFGVLPSVESEFYGTSHLFAHYESFGRGGYYHAPDYANAAGIVYLIPSNKPVHEVREELAAIVNNKAICHLPLLIVKNIDDDAAVDLEAEIDAASLLADMTWRAATTTCFNNIKKTSDIKSDEPLTEALKWMVTKAMPAPAEKSKSLPVASNLKTWLASIFRPKISA